MTHLVRAKAAYQIAASLAVADTVFEPVFERAEQILKEALIADANKLQARAEAVVAANGT